VQHRAVARHYPRKTSSRCWKRVSVRLAKGPSKKEVSPIVIFNKSSHQEQGTPGSPFGDTSSSPRIRMRSIVLAVISRHATSTIPNSILTTAPCNGHRSSSVPSSTTLWKKISSAQAPLDKTDSQPSTHPSSIAPWKYVVVTIRNSSEHHRARLCHNLPSTNRSKFGFLQQSSYRQHHSSSSQ